MTDASKSLDVNLVTVEELEPPPGEAPVSWRLYTSEPINTKAAVLLVVDAYRARWRIEEYFKALKTGCALEKRQLGSLDAILNLLAVCMPIAWQMLALRARARRAPDDAATKVLTAVQVEILRRTARRPLPPKPTVQDALEAVASLGGHLKRNGSPGWITLGAGFEKLYILEAGFRLASQM